MSGGVDSAVAALLLLRRGYRVSGLFMKNWEEDDSRDQCTAEEDLRAARAACDHLGIPLRTVNLSHEYWERVFENFLAGYRAGRTPNPDVACNTEIKFRAFLDHAMGLGAKFIATGHYARVAHTPPGVRLLKGRDADKDQSYFLHALSSLQLDRVLFPLGNLEKRQVRALARETGLPNHDRKDSTGICFIGERRFREFLGHYVPGEPGDIVSTGGERMGRHGGLMFHTIGQRKGLGIGGRRGAGEAPWYVVDKDTRHNRLIVAQGRDHPAMYRDQLIARDWHWISGRQPALPLRCHVRIRHRQPVQPCTLDIEGEGAIRVRFDSPQRSVAPGQFAVAYLEEDCLGGGVIGHDPVSADG
ncbi:MAG: tRNA 2-thiouridine(34) synthase MnmA [Pseudomonadota bacterium]|nr:tRNA 2-thiouridine(34) synthase MnmA [Pseudomonadota bacterium]